MQTEKLMIVKQYILFASVVQRKVSGPLLHRIHRVLPLTCRLGRASGNVDTSARCWHFRFSRRSAFYNERIFSGRFQNKPKCSLRASDTTHSSFSIFLAQFDFEYWETPIFGPHSSAHSSCTKEVLKKQRAVSLGRIYFRHLHSQKGKDSAMVVHNQW